MTKQIIADKLAAYFAVNTPSWGRREYPLFTQDAANACPTARYVGGASRWLCECRSPGNCGGVLAAAMGQPDGVAVESANVEIARLGVVTIDHPVDPENGGPLWIYRGEMLPRPKIAGDYLADLFRMFGIRPGVAKHRGRWTVQVFAIRTGQDSHLMDNWTTEINGTPDEIRRHFVGKIFPMGGESEYLVRATRVNFLAVE